MAEVIVVVEVHEEEEEALVFCGMRVGLFGGTGGGVPLGETVRLAGGVNTGGCCVPTLAGWPLAATVVLAKLEDTFAGLGGLTFERGAVGWVGVGGFKGCCEDFLAVFTKGETAALGTIDEPTLDGD